MGCCKDDICKTEKLDPKLKQVFTIVLAINLVMFFVELIYGITARSNALIADSLDMLGDTFVYGVTLYVLTKSLHARTKASFMKGIIMLLLGLYVIYETISKIINPIVPAGEIISIIGILALVANLICFLLLMKYKNGDLNVRSAWICSRNDVIGNISVIIAGLLVIYLGSMWPDIIVGFAMAVLVLQSSVQVIIEAYKKFK